MDRELQVYSGGYLFAESTFVYAGKNKGSREITVFRTVPIDGGDHKAVVPLYHHRLEFEHDELEGVEDVISYDLSLLAKEQEPVPPDAELVYLPVNYRMAAGGGVADIDSDFSRNTKHLRFISARSKKDDLEADTDALETNVDLVARVISGRKADGQEA